MSKFHCGICNTWKDDSQLAGLGTNLSTYAIAPYCLTCKKED